MKYLAILLAVVMTIPALTTLSFAKGDAKYYGEVVIKKKLNDKFDLFFTPEVRLKNGMRDAYYYQFRVGSTYHAHKHLDLAAAYRYIQNRDSRGEWDNNDMQYIESIIIPKAKFKGFIITDANKWEYRFIENGDNRWVYRNEIKVARPIKFCNFEFTPYVANEIYYDFRVSKANLNWLTFGATKKLNKYITVGLYYRNEAARVGNRPKWALNNILGTNITVEF